MKSRRSRGIKEGQKKEARTVLEIVILFLSKFVDFLVKSSGVVFNEMCSDVLVKADVLRRAGAMNNGDTYDAIS